MNLHYEAREIVNALQEFMVCRDMSGLDSRMPLDVAKERLIELIQQALEKAAEK